MKSDFEKFWDLALEQIPDNTSKKFELDGYDCFVKRDGDNIYFNFTSKETFEDVKKLVSEFKDNIKELDDDLFIESIKDMKEKFEIKEFSELLDSENFNKDSAMRIKELIKISSNIICSHLQNKIEGLVKLHNKF